MAQPAVKMYSTRFCPYCIRARQLLEAKGVVYEDLSVDANPALRQTMRAESGRHTVPQIWIGETHVGGFDDLYLLERQGELDTLLHSASTLLQG
jgi:glutaredoxin 3